MKKYTVKIAIYGADFFSLFTVEIFSPQWTAGFSLVIREQYLISMQYCSVVQHRLLIALLYGLDDFNPLHIHAES